MFSLPFLPPSMNSLYNVLYALRRVEMKPEVRLYKTKAKQFVPLFQLKKDEVLSITFVIHSSWRYKNGNFKKIDPHNLEKVLVDAICEKIGIDDTAENIRHKETFVSINPKEEKVEVILRKWPKEVVQV